MAVETLLIGWDGATYTLLDPLMAQGIMPNLKNALSGGCRADLVSVTPALTPPAWTSLATGQGPGCHGIFDFFQKESAESIHLRPAHSRNVKTDTLWTILNGRGLRATVLNFPVTFPPPPINGYVVSGGWLTRRQLRLACHPGGLYDEILGLKGMDLKELIMDLAEEERAVEGCSRDETVEFVEKHTRRERHWLAILSHLLDKDPTELVSVVFDGVDKVQHLCWPVLAAFASGRPTPASDARLLDACLNYYRELDDILGALSDRMGPGSNLFLVSDHGFGESSDLFFVNQWLKDNGFLAWKDAIGPKALPGKSLGMGHLARHVFEMDWERTRAFAATPSSNGIHLVSHGRASSHEQDPGEKAAICTALIEGLSAVRSPSTGLPLVERIWTREQIFPGPCGDLGPDLTLCLRDGGLVSILASESAVVKRAAPVGAHRPQGIFMGLGPAFARGNSLAPFSILDVAPMVLNLLGLDIPASMTGDLHPEALTDSYRTGGPRLQGPAGSGAPSRGPAALRDEPLFTEEDEQAIAERLRQLGYIE